MNSWATIYLARVTARMSKNVKLAIAIFTLITTLLVQVNGDVHQNDRTVVFDQTNPFIQGSQPFSEALGYTILNGFAEPSLIDDRNGYADPYQTNITSDLLDLLGGYIMRKQQQQQALLSEKDKINSNGLVSTNNNDYNIRGAEEDNDLMQTIVNFRRASDNSISVDQQNEDPALNSAQIDLEGFKNIMTTLQHDNNDLDGPYQKDSSNDNSDRDQSGTGSIPEMIEHQPILSGHQYVQGGAGEGHQLLGPDGSFENIQVIKTDTALPSYCDPPNPCPIGYTNADGCIEDFLNTASFSREFQANQDCACDSEHSLFDCPSETNNSKIEADGSSNGSEASDKKADTQLTTLARSIQNRLEGVNLRDIENRLNRLYESKVNNNNNINANPYLVGDKLPIVAKKAPKIYENHF